MKSRISGTIGSHQNPLKPDSLACFEQSAVGHDRVGLIVLFIGQVHATLYGLSTPCDISLGFLSSVIMMMSHEKSDANSSSSRSANTNSNRLTGPISARRRYV